MSIQTIVKSCNSPMQDEQFSTQITQKSWVKWKDHEVFGITWNILLGKLCYCKNIVQVQGKENLATISLHNVLSNIGEGWEPLGWR